MLLCAGVVVKNKLEEEGTRGLLVEGLMNFPVPPGAVSVVSAERQRELLSRQGGEAWLCLSSVERREKAGV